MHLSHAMLLIKYKMQNHKNSRLDTISAALEDQIFNLNSIFAFTRMTRMIHHVVTIHLWPITANLIPLVISPSKTKTSLDQKQKPTHFTSLNVEQKVLTKPKCSGLWPG